MIYRYTPFLFPRGWCSYKVGIPLTTARVNSPHSIYRWFCCYVGKIWESIVLHKLEIIHFWNDSSRIHHQLNGDLLLPLSFSQKLYPHFRSNPLPAAKGTLRGQATSMGELSPRNFLWPARFFMLEPTNIAISPSKILKPEEIGVQPTKIGICRSFFMGS